MTLDDFIRDPAIVDALADAGNKLIMVIGGSDTGKTTLIRLLSDFLSIKSKAGIVDLDMGQSHIGPPTTIAWGKVTGAFTDWSDILVEDFYFAGTVTPFGNLLPSLVGAKLMTDQAMSSVRKVIVDTTGLIAEPVGRVLKQYKIDILRPDIVLALERSEELTHILDPFRFQRTPEIYRIHVPHQIRRKSLFKRADYRFRKIKAYFNHAEVIEISLDEIGIRSAKDTLHFSHSGLKNRIVSFRDKKNEDLALGVITEAKAREKKLMIRTPIEKAADFSSIVIGKTELDITNSMLRDRP